jgi:hypothetical protein
MATCPGNRRGANVNGAFRFRRMGNRSKIDTYPVAGFHPEPNLSLPENTAAALANRLRCSSRALSVGPPRLPVDAGIGNDRVPAVDVGEEKTFW